MPDSDERPAESAPDQPSRQETYPRFVKDSEPSRRRWDLSMAVAARVMGEGAGPQHVRFAAERLFSDPDLPTD